MQWRVCETMRKAIMHILNQRIESNKDDTTQFLKRRLNLCLILTLFQIAPLRAKLFDDFHDNFRNA